VVLTFQTHVFRFKMSTIIYFSGVHIFSKCIICCFEFVIGTCSFIVVINDCCEANCVHIPHLADFEIIL
jgi:uncharacterized membrane protein required for colicin V production